MPFGLCWVATACADAGHVTRVLDLCFCKNPSAEIQHTIGDFRPDVVGIGIRNIDSGTGHSTEFHLDDVNDHVVEPIKAAFCGPIVIGGSAVGINAREILGLLDLEYAVRGDGETTMVELLRRHASGQPWTEVPGLVESKQGRIVSDEPPCRVADLDSLPWPRFHDYLDLDAYRRTDSPLLVQTKRGCALGCVYCVYNQVEGETYRLRDPQQVAGEIERLVEETGINHIEFTDSTFNIPLEHARGVLRAVIRNGMDLRLRTMGVNPGAVDEELVDLMKEAGFVDVDLGAESGCDVTLAGLGKNYTKQDVLRAGSLLHGKGISITWFLLFGAPGETRATVEETLETITSAAASDDLICVSVGVRAYRGTTIAKQMEKRNPEVGADGFLRPVDYEPDGISLDEIKYLVKRAWFSHPNLLIAPDDEVLSLASQVWVVRLLRLLGSRQPSWKLYIHTRRLFKRLGLMRLQRFGWERKQGR
jgi:radical SAM superfamily enzyme YgiQ (UPF0313 family)